MKTLRPDRAGHLGQGGGGDELHARGHRQQLPRRDGDPLGVPAAGEQRAHLVAHRPAGHALADLADHAAALQPEDVAGALRRRVEALALHQVGPVHGRRDDVDDHLAGPAHRIGHLADQQDLGSTGRADDDRAHTRDRMPRCGSGHDPPHDPDAGQARAHHPVAAEPSLVSRCRGARAREGRRIQARRPGRRGRYRADDRR